MLKKFFQSLSHWFKYRFIWRLKASKKAVLVILLTIFALMAIIGGVYLKTKMGWKWADWTGFTDYTDITGTYYRGKTLWDWMELLIVPLAIAIIAYFFNKSERERVQKVANIQAKNALQIESDRYQENRLQNYLDRITDLLLEENLRTSKVKDEVRIIARAKTLAVLQDLDGDRKRAIIQFLYEANLITGDKPIIQLDNANLKKANLMSLHLKKVNLKNTNLSHAQLGSANLEEANLESAFLSNAHFGHANLLGARICGARFDETFLRWAKFDNRTDLSNAWFENVDLEKFEFNGAILQGARFVDTNIKETDFSKSNLNRAEFGGYGGPVQMQKAKLINANLQDACFYGANLEKTNFTGANLTGANFKDIFGKSNLLNGTIFINAIVDLEQLQRADSLINVTLPNGEKYNSVER